MILARVHPDSMNAKLGGSVGSPIAASYMPIGPTCDPSCALHPDRNGGCYAAGGLVALRTRGMGSETPEAHAQACADGVDALPRDGRPLRHAVSGDGRTPRAARIMGAAFSRFRGTGGGPVWGYTHAGHKVPREAWGPDIALRASVDTLRRLRAAQRRGYTVFARVFSQRVFDSAMGKAFTAWGLRWVPCPNETPRKRTCAQCRLCWREGVNVAFRIKREPRKPR